jgi:hypothetical protein
MKTTSALAALLLALTTAGLDQAPRRTGALAPGGTGLIAGRVVDPVSGGSVRDALVWLMIDGAMWPESPRVMTDAEGRFVFVNVPAGKYSFQAQKTGYVPGRYGAKTVMDLGRDLDLADGQLITDLRVPIWKHVTIGGTVIDEAGEPVVGVSVYALRKTVTFGEIRYTPNFRGSIATTDDRGMYRVAALVPGEFLVSVPSAVTTFPADVMPELSRPEIQSEAFNAISELSPLGAARTQQVGGSVILSGNRAILPPALDAQVTAAYRTTLFPAATKLGDATSIGLRSGEERSGVDLVLRPVRAGRVSGRIVGLDEAVGPTAIRLIPDGDAFLAGEQNFDGATGMSDAAGRFTLLGVPEGQYIAWIERRLPRLPDQPAGTTRLFYGREPVSVGRDGVADVVVTLKPAPRITAKLDVSGAGAQPQGLEVLVEAVGLGGRAALIPDSTRPIRPSSTQLIPGRYVVTPYTTGEPCTSVAYQGRDVSDEPLLLAAEDVEVTLICGQSPTRLSGTVRDARGSVDDDAVAVAFPAERRFWSGAELRARRKVSAFTSTSGAFSMSNLPPGEYLVAALPIEGSDFWQDPKVLDKLTSVATRVVLGPGESRTVDVRTVRIR